ncbi:MAG: class I SAM-dependent methyltransferase [Candidatus Micrarchaeota archaeon]|nr:class I SAM-dependent methyltransferase [Candidatus Micrarchaeota archaeon]
MHKGTTVAEKKSWEKWWREVIRHNGKVTQSPFNKKLSIDGKHVLDVGCGNLINEFYLGTKMASFVGVDLSKRALAKAKRIYPRANLVLADAANLPFADNTFDVVVSTNVLFYLGGDFERSLKEITRVAAEAVVLNFAHSERLKYTKGDERTFAGWKIYGEGYVGVDEASIAKFLNKRNYEVVNMDVRTAKKQVTTSIENGVVKHTEIPWDRELRSEIYVEATKRG